MNQEQIFREEVRAALAGVNLSAVVEIAALREKIVLDDSEVAKLYGWSASTLRRWRCEGIGPRFIRDGRMVFYRRSDIDAYISSRVVLTRDQQ